MTKSKHYRTVPVRILLRGAEDMKRGYESAFGSELKCESVLDYFKGSKYCVELYEHVRNATGASQTYCIGWALGREERFLDKEIDRFIRILANAKETK